MFRVFQRHILHSLFRVQEGEGQRVLLMLLYSIAVVGGVIITGQLASRALFLSNLPESAIPFKFILPPVVLMAVSAVYTRAAGRFRSDRLIFIFYALFLVGALLFRLLLETAYRQSFGTLCALFVFFDIVSSLTILQFWTFAGEIFNPREARRLFGLISGGSTISNILFGALLASISSIVAPENLIFIVIGSLAVCMVCVHLLSRHHREALEEEGSEEENAEQAKNQKNWSTLRDAVREVLHSPLVLSMSGVLILVALASSIADYQLDLALQAHFGGDSQGIVGFLSQFRLWAGLGAGLLQFLLAGRLLERFGVVAGLLLLPAAMVLGAGAILLTGGLLLAAAVPRACDVILKYTVNDAAFNLLYLPVDAQLRAKARAILDGILKPPVVALLGLLFLWVGQSGNVTITHWAYVLLALVVIWVLLVLHAGRQYVVALSQSIRLRRLDPDQEKIDLSDESSIRVIRHFLHEEDAARVVHALSLLPGIPKIDWMADVAVLLEHADPQVRVLALKYLGAQGEAAALYAQQVHTLLHDRQEKVQAAAIESLCALGRLRVIEQMLPFLEDPSPRIRSAAVLGLIKHAGLDGILHAGEHLKALLDNPDPQGRLEGVRVLEALQVPTFYHPLIPLLADVNIEVQIGTIRAATRIGTPELIPYLLPKLSHPLTRWYATDALNQCIGQDLPRLEELLQNDRHLPEARRQLIHLLAHHHSPQAVQLLVAQLHSDDDLLRSAAYQTLVKLRDAGLSIPGQPLRGVLHEELRSAYELHVVRHDLRRTHGLLEEGLERRIRQAEDRILTLLDLLHPDLSHTQIRESLDDRSSRLRATVIELLDNVVEREMNELLLPLFGPSASERLEVARGQLRIPERSGTEILRQLATTADSWLRSCALHAIGESLLEQLGDPVDASLDDPDPLVRETARTARARLDRARQTPLPKDPSSPSQPGGDSAMALSTLEKVFFLKSASLFEQIPGEEIIGMVPIIHEVEIKEGETFIKKGDDGDCLYILVAGRVHIKRDAEHQDTAQSREVIGEISVLTEQPRSADCTALTDVVALRIDKKDFWTLMEEQPQITIEVLKVIVDRYI